VRCAPASNARNRGSNREVAEGPQEAPMSRSVLGSQV